MTIQDICKEIIKKEEKVDASTLEKARKKKGSFFFRQKGRKMQKCTCGTEVGIAQSWWPSMAHNNRKT